MKKVFLSSLLIVSTLMLASCQVNWFGSHFDVPWYFIAVPVVVLFVVLYVIMISKTYVCPKCKPNSSQNGIKFILQYILTALALQSVLIAEEKDFAK